jgi:hypothetical protein
MLRAAHPYSSQACLAFANPPPAETEFNPLPHPAAAAGIPVNVATKTVAAGRPCLPAVAAPQALQAGRPFSCLLSLFPTDEASTQVSTHNPSNLLT